MAKVLLDTDILSEYLKGHDKIVARHAADYAHKFGAFTFTSVTVHEIVFGLEFKGATAQLKKALAWLNQNDEITPVADDYLEAAIIKGFHCELWTRHVGRVEVDADQPEQSFQRTAARRRNNRFVRPLVSAISTVV